MTHADVCKRLEYTIAKYGSLTQAAGALMVSPQLLSAVLGGKRAIGPKLLDALRLRRTITKLVTFEEVPHVGVAKSARRGRRAS